jgi:hypothetical protein
MVEKYTGPADVCEKTVNEGMASQRACVDIVKEHRFEPFLWEHGEPFIETIRAVQVHPDQSKECIDLWQKSYLLHYDIIKSLTKTINAMDCAFLEWQQTPIALNLAYKYDPDFRAAIEEFCNVIDESEDIIGIEAMRVHSGFYGIISSKDFAALPGSTFNVIVRLLERTPIERKYKEAIMAAKSWGLNTIYVFGDRFTATLRKCQNVQAAIEQEQRYLRWIWDEPEQVMKKLMGTLGHSSYDRFKYFDMYKRKFEPVVKAAFDAGVHVSNIIMLPTHVGDLGHHVGPSYYNLCRDEMCMNILEVLTQMADSTVRRAYAMGKIKVPFDVATYATGACAAGMAEILAWDGFTADMFMDLLQKRFKNYVLTHPYDRGMVGELHVNDWLDFATRGDRIIKSEATGGFGRKTAGVPVDFQPLRQNHALNNPQWYSYPYTSITVRASALFRFVDQPCMLAPEAPSINALVNQTALAPERAMAPVQLCKHCATARYLPAKCNYCRSPDLGLGIKISKGIEE